MKLGFGYIIIPTNIDRDEYVETALNRERVTILLDKGRGMPIKDCYIDRSVLQSIKFPESNDDLGSLVVYFQETQSVKPIVIAHISAENQTQLLKEHEFLVKKSYEDNTVKVSGNAENSVLSLKAENLDGKSSINISCNGDKSSSVNIFSSGTATIRSNEPVDIQASKFSVNNGSSPIVKGDSNTEILTEIKDILSDISTALTTFATAQAGVASGTLAPLAPAYSTLISDMVPVIADVQGLVVKIKANNSDISFTD